MEGDCHTTKKKKIVVVLGATGAGKSRLAIDLAVSSSSSSSLGIKFEIVNADSMQVYKGLDVLTNKVPSHDQKGIPHHFLGTVDPQMTDFTAKHFRDLAIRIIDDIFERDCVPIIVGGTNYYIQALVSSFLADDLVDDIDESRLSHRRDDMLSMDCEIQNSKDLISTYDTLKELDPVAANRIHPNDHRKIDLYLSLYRRSGIPPSELLRGKNVEKWGRSDTFRYDCCFLWVDASLPVIDQYVDERVDIMVENGLVDEVYDIYNPKADYTRGLRQAIGVSEFEEIFTNYFQNIKAVENEKLSDNSFREFLNDDKHQKLFSEAIDKMKMNTRRLVRRQKRRINRLKTLFGWDVHYFDVTEALKGDSVGFWEREVVEPCTTLVQAFLSNDTSMVSSRSEIAGSNLDARNLWTQYVCEACGDRILRGEHEWEQHKIGRTHRKRMSRLKKKLTSSRPIDH